METVQCARVCMTVHISGYICRAFLVDRIVRRARFHTNVLAFCDSCHIKEDWADLCTPSVTYKSINVTERRFSMSRSATMRQVPRKKKSQFMCDVTRSQSPPKLPM